MSLVTGYLATFAGGGAPSEPALEEELADVVARARAAWPDIHVEAFRFVSYLGARAATDQPPLLALRAMHTDDLYIACACVDRDPAAAVEVERRHLQPARGYIRRSAPDLADDVHMAVAADLLVGQDGAPGIARYSGRGALGAFVRLAAIRRSMHLKRGRKETAVADLEPGVDADVEVELLKRMYAPEFQAAFAVAIASLEPSARAAMKMHFLDGMTLEAIGAIYRVNKSTVSRWITTARRDLFDEARRLFSERLRLPASEVDSLMELLQSRVQLTLSWFL